MRAVLDRGHAARAWDNMAQFSTRFSWVMPSWLSSEHAWRAVDMLTSSFKRQAQEGDEARGNSERLDKEFVG